jgi:hypothetical protein
VNIPLSLYVSCALSGSGSADQRSSGGKHGWWVAKVCRLLISSVIVQNRYVTHLLDVEYNY